MAYSTNVFNGPTPQDVYAARRALLHLLPAELANLILDEARYWPSISCNFHPVVSMVHVTERQAVCCILSPRIPEITDSPMRITQIRFRIESHDQGWGGENLPGPYDGSYTWFESIIVRDFRSEPQTIDGTQEIEEMLGATRYMKPTMQQDSVYIWTKQYEPPSSWFLGWFGGRVPAQTLILKTVKNPNTNSDTWDIQRNRRASPVDRTHIVVWTQEVDNEVDEKALYELTGSSLGIDFIKSIQPGDRVAVLARAQYTGWANWVKGVSMDIFFSV